MAREDLVNSAIAFLQDPSMASAPLDKRIQFLQSKNLTEEEIDIALSRTVEDRQQTNAQNPSYSSPTQYNQQYSYRRPPVQYGYNPYMDRQIPLLPPEPPRRDWRDWFIMATVIGGASFGLYSLAQRYIQPLIAPPTPPQLEQDKAAIDEEFARAFALLDILSSDTAALKQAEETRTQRLDTALAEVESVVDELKRANRRREDESQRNSDEVRVLLRDGIPRTMESMKEASDQRLGQLGKELSSLRSVISNRLGGNDSLTPHPPPASSLSPSTSKPSIPKLSSQIQTTGSSSGIPTSPAASTATSNPKSRPSENSYNKNGNTDALPTAVEKQDNKQNPNNASLSTQSHPPNRISLPLRSQDHVTSGGGEGESSLTAFAFGSMAGKASIPAWQLAAANEAQGTKNRGDGADDGNDDVVGQEISGSS